MYYTLEIHNQQRVIFSSPKANGQKPIQIPFSMTQIFLSLFFNFAPFAVVRFFGFSLCDGADRLFADILI